MKKTKHTFKTRTRDGKRFMICRNSIEDKNHWSWEQFKDKPRCANWSEVGSDTVAVLCSNCTQKTVEPPSPRRGYVSKGRPRGWQFMKEFVDPQGNVFHKGVEQPHLKGTLEPTKIEPKNNKKLSKREKEELKDQILQQIAFTRGEIKKAKWKKDVKAGHVKMRRLQRKLKKLN
jgi:hypothetical protein